MTDKELMQQALDALKLIDEAMPFPVAKLTIKNLSDRLAQPQMQPCAGRNCGSTNPNLHSAECFEDYEKTTGMNQWQRLTDEEIIDVLHPLVMADMSDEATDYEIARAIEAALRSKNT